MYFQSVKEAVSLIIHFDREVFTTVIISLRIAFFSVLFSSVISIILAFIIDKQHGRTYRFLRALFNSLMAVPTVVIGLFIYGFISRSGLLGSLSLLYTPFAISLGQSILIIPIITSFILSGFSEVDHKLSETLKTLGLSGFKYYISFIKETKMTIASSVLAGFGRVIGEVGISMMLGGNIRMYTRTITTTIALETNKGEFAKSLSLGIILIILAISLNLIINFYLKNGKKTIRL